MILLVILFAALFGASLLFPVSNLVQVPAVYAAQGYGDQVPWALLIAGVAIPPLLFAAGLLVGRRRPLFAKALVLTVALAASSALGLGVIFAGYLV